MQGIKNPIKTNILKQKTQLLRILKTNIMSAKFRFVKR